MDNFFRRYCERELIAGIAPSPSMKEHFGYRGPFRHFVQREDFSPQANEIPNNMPSWLPGQVSSSCLTQNTSCAGAQEPVP